MTKQLDKTLCVISFKRHKDNQIVYIKLNPLISKLFITDKIETSERWKDENGQGLQFYAFNENLRDFTTRLGANFDTVNFHKFGSRLFDNNEYVNLSFFRAVGIENGISIKLDGVLSFDVIQAYEHKLIVILRKLYENFAEPIEKTLTITLET